MAEYKETLRRLALNDESFVESVLGMGRDTVEVSRLDPKTHALVRLGASLAIDAAPSSYQSNVEVALAAGASIDEIVEAAQHLAGRLGVPGGPGLGAEAPDHRCGCSGCDAAGAAARQAPHQARDHEARAASGSAARRSVPHRAARASRRCPGAGSAEGRA